MTGRTGGEAKEKKARTAKTRDPDTDRPTDTHTYT